MAAHRGIRQGLVAKLNGGLQGFPFATIDAVGEEFSGLW